MAHAFGQSVRKQGRFPCSRCETDFGSKRNRRRHRKLRHSEDWIMNYPPQNQPSSSGASKADQSRSAQAAERRERAKLEAQQELLNKQVQLEPEMLKKRRNKNKKVAYVEENSTEPVQEHEQEVEFASHEEFLEHHTKMYREKKLCKCRLCTDATAQGVRNLPQSLQVRERSHTYFCQLCGEPFKHQGALRSHYSTRHTTKNLLNEAREYPRPDSWDRLSESGYNALDVGRDRGGVDDAEDGVDDTSS